MPRSDDFHSQKDGRQVLLRGSGKRKEGEWIGQVEISIWKTSWQWAKHAWLYSDPIQALKGEHFSA